MSTRTLERMLPPTILELEEKLGDLAEHVSHFGPRSVPSELRRSHLLTAASITFIRDGFEGTSMQSIAEAAGVSKPVIYALFTSKEQLFAAVVDHTGDDLGNRLATATKGSGSQLKSGIRAFLEYLRDRHELWGPILSATQHNAVAEAVRRLQTQQLDLVVAALTRGHQEAGLPVDGPELQALAHLVAGAVTAIANFWSDNPELEIDELSAFAEAALAPSLTAIRTDRPTKGWFTTSDHREQPDV